MSLDGSRPRPTRKQMKWARKRERTRDRIERLKAEMDQYHSEQRMREMETSN